MAIQLDKDYLDQQGLYELATNRLAKAINETRQFLQEVDAERKPESPGILREYKTRDVFLKVRASRHLEVENTRKLDLNYNIAESTRKITIHSTRLQMEGSVVTTTTKEFENNTQTDIQRMDWNSLRETNNDHDLTNALIKKFQMLEKNEENVAIPGDKEEMPISPLCNYMGNAAGVAKAVDVCDNVSFIQNI